MKNKKLLKASSMYFIGNIFDKAVAFITIPIFTRLLSTSDYGVTTTYLSWISILSVVITLSIGNSIRTAIVDYNNDVDGYISSIFTLGSLSAFVITGIILIFTILFDISFSVKLILLCCVHAYASSILSTIQWKYMMEVNYIKKTLLQCIPNLLIVILSVILINVIHENKYYGRIYAYASINIFIALAYVVLFLFRGKKFYNKIYWQYALAFSLPIIFHSISNVVLSQADRSMITLLRNTSETGIYGVAYQFGMVPLVVTTTFENIWIPWFTERMKCSDKEAINRMVKPYLYSVCIICMGIMLIAPEVLKYMTTTAYYSAVYYISPIVAAMFLMFLASVSVDLEYYLKKTKTIAANTLIAATANVVLNLIFIPKFGGVAAAYTTVACYGISFLMHHFVSKKLDKELFPFRVYIIPLTLVSVTMILTNIMMNLPAIRWGVGIILGILFLVLSYKFICSKGESNNEGCCNSSDEVK